RHDDGDAVLPQPARTKNEGREADAAAPRGQAREVDAARPVADASRHRAMRRHIAEPAAGRDAGAVHDVARLWPLGLGAGAEELERHAPRRGDEDEAGLRARPVALAGEGRLHLRALRVHLPGIPAVELVGLDPAGP